MEFSTVSEEKGKIEQLRLNSGARKERLHTLRKIGWLWIKLQTTIVVKKLLKRNLTVMNGTIDDLRKDIQTLKADHGVVSMIHDLI